jgi:membrane fusion protein, peptide pheromone/bacteriocin exporter
MNIPTLDPDFCIEKQIFRHDRKSRSIYGIATFAVFAALVSLPFLKVDIVVHGSGAVRPIAEKVELQASTTGSIVRVHVREGDRLSAGDTILLLNTASVDASIQYQHRRQENLNDQIRDLQILGLGRKPPAFRSDKRHQEYILYHQQAQQLQVSQDDADRKLLRNRSLYESGVIPEEEFENYQLEKERSSRELKTLRENQRSIWNSDLDELIREQDETTATLRRLQQERDLYTLRAPIQGTLEEFSGLYAGGYLNSGQTLCTISPDSTLIVENYIEPKDIGFLHPDMRVKIRAEAFDYNQWGTLSGQVTDISSDYLLIDNKAFYKVKCRLDRPYLMLKNGRKGYLKKGMTVQTRFLVNRRSLLRLLYEKMDDWANPANPP